MFEKVWLHLIDFGLASDWRDKTTNKHVPETTTKFFEGNMYFSNIQQLQIKRTSRRDDFHSLMYILIYILNRGSIPAFDQVLAEN